MTYIKLLLLTIINLFQILSVAIGQDNEQLIKLRKNYDSKYGYNADLYCGVKYFPEHSVAKGFPFYKSNEALTGTLVFNNKKYEKLGLLYNLYKQNILLEYKDQNNSINRLVLNEKKIDTIFINNRIFIRNYYPEIQEKFLEVLFTDSLKLYIGRKKQYLFDNSLGHSEYKFSGEIKTYYLVYNNEVNKFSSRRNYLTIFPKELRKKIKKYTVRNKVKIEKQNDNKILQLVTYCNMQLINK
ncbi:MAG: hypothetical protein GXO79_14980 [Chlorobi bacterium]|nr:hypothetical protein [Chlorobiota bacterium]